MQQATLRKKSTGNRSRKTAQTRTRPAIEPTRNYNRKEAAIACDVSEITLFRAYDSGNLKAYRVGARILHSGRHLLDWLEAGGRTGRTVENVRKERAEK